MANFRFNQTADVIHAAIRRHWILVPLILIVCAWNSDVALGQKQDTAPIVANDATAIFQANEFSPLFWEFGIQVDATSPARNIEVVFPLPTSQPEQVVTEISQNLSNNVTNISFDELADNLRVAVVQIQGLNAGESARATIKLKVEKSDIMPPKDTSLLHIPKTVAPKLKDYLKPSPYIEVRDKDVKAFAATFEPDPNLTDWDQIEWIYDTLRERIDYEFDVTIRTCPDAIEAGKGDCEELTSLFIAILRNRGIPARAVWIPHHTYPEFYLEDEEGNGHWFPCQVAGSRQFGQMIESKPVLQKGDKFKVPGHSKPIRYVQPTLKALTDGGLSLVSIQELISDAEDK
ncbi:MAG: transglutaminase family protein [Pirellulaceae bacterium]